MKLIRDDRDLAQVEDVELRSLIEMRIASIAEFVDHFSELACFVIVEAGDRLEDVDAVLGFPLLGNRFDGTTYGEPGFTPAWDVIEAHAAWFEIVFVASDDGAGVYVFIQKSDGVPRALLDLCNEYAAPVKEGA